MTKQDVQPLVEELLDRHGLTFAQELGIHIEHGTPSSLFQMLCAALLFSTRISAGAAVQAGRALLAAGWTTPEKMASASWSERVQVLNRHGYARYDESTSRMLGDTAQLLLDEYGGDLRRLREAAGQEPAEERERLKAFKGIGDVGVDIFFREVQLVWPELYPFADQRARAAAGDLGLPTQADKLAGLVARDDFPRLVAALVRTKLAHDEDEVKAEAGR